MARFVDVETPYMGENHEQVKRNIFYARACVRDCLLRDEVPFASHLFFTQSGILDDNVPMDRTLGINAGKELIESLPGIVTVVYQDLGISRGMQYGIDRAISNNRTVEYRFLSQGWEDRAITLAKNHSHAAIWGI